MKIIQVLYSLNLGGIEEFSLNMAKSLSNASIENYVLLMSKGFELEWYNKTKKTAEENGVKFLDVAKYSKISKFRAINMLFKKIKPDILIIHHENISLSYIPIVLFKKTKIIQIQHRLDQTKIDLHRKLLKHFIYKYVAVSSDVGKNLKRNLVIKSEKLEIISNGINNAEYSSIKRDDNVIRIITVGRFVKSKNYVEVANIFNELLKEDTIKKLRFVMAGSGVEFDKVKNTILADPRVSLPGALSDVKPLYQIADIYVSYSSIEGFSLAMLEAMASGCAVITTATSGSIEIINNHNGILVGIDDLDAFSVSLRRLINDEKFRNKLSEEAIKTAQKYDYSYTFSKYLDLFRKAVSPNMN